MNRKPAHGVSSTVSLSSATEVTSRPAPLSLPAQYALLVGAGALAVALHQSLRLPLHLPGHHGIEWLAILVLARLLARTPAAGLVAGFGAAATLMALSGGVGIDGRGAQMLTYLLQGALLDALFAASLRLPLRWLWIAIIGAAVHSVAPLVKNALAAFGPASGFGSLLNGVAYPLFTHAVFGAAGALIGLAMHAAAQRMKA